MIKAIKILGLFDVVMIAVGIIMWQSTKGANDFSGLIVIYPMIGFGIATLAILILIFLQSLRAAKGANRSQPGYWAIPFLIGIPGLGLYYSFTGENRVSLVIFCTGLLLAGIIGVMRILISTKR